MKPMCHICGEREATFHYRENINGREKELHLCPICAKEKGIYHPSLFFAEELGAISPLMETRRLGEERAGVCPRCKTSLSTIKKQGVFGCSSCYDTFSSVLDMTPFVGQGYAGGRLSEKVESPKQEEKKEEASPERVLAELKKALREAVDREHYEKAAKIRDQIRELEGR